MIEMITGTNGAGKTLYLVKQLAALFKRWESHPEESRPVYVHNVRELTFPVLQLPHTKQVLKGIEYIVPLWDEMPMGSLVWIDECQKVFPVRSSQSAPPEHVLWFTEHRRLGFDFWMTTQLPKFTDPMVRGLTGRHLHFRRLFGMHRSIIYEWDACNDSLSGFKTAVKTYFPFPKDVFQFYKSAEIHTKQKFRLPLWFGLPIVAAVLALVFVPRAFHVLHGGVGGQGLTEMKLPASAVPSILPAKQPDSFSQVNPVGGYQAPSGLNFQPQVIAPQPRIQACLASAAKCSCYDAHGVMIPLPEPECRLNAAQPTDKYRFDDSQSRQIDFLPHDSPPHLALQKTVF